jgi:hypothetical protein
LGLAPHKPWNRCYLPHGLCVSTTGHADPCALNVSRYYHNINGSLVTGQSPFEIWLNEAVTVHIQRQREVCAPCSPPPCSCSPPSHVTLSASLPLFVCLCLSLSLHTRTSHTSHTSYTSHTTHIRPSLALYDSPPLPSFFNTYMSLPLLNRTCSSATTSCACVR